MKPILIIKLPNSVPMTEFQGIAGNFKKHSVNNDYHVIIVMSQIADDVEFQGLFPKDFDESSFEDLKRELKEQIIVL